MESYALELKGCRVTETDLIAMCNGQWIGSDVRCILLTSVKHDKLFIFHKTTLISFFIKLLELEHILLHTQKQGEERMVFQHHACFYQCWLSFLHKSNGKNPTLK